MAKKHCNFDCIKQAYLWNIRVPNNVILIIAREAYKGRLEVNRGAKTEKSGSTVGNQASVPFSPLIVKINRIKRQGEVRYTNWDYSPSHKSNPRTPMYDQGDARGQQGRGTVRKNWNFQTVYYRKYSKIAIFGSNGILNGKISRRGHPPS